MCLVFVLRGQYKKCKKLRSFKVVIYGADDLKKADLFTWADPYVVLKFLDLQSKTTFPGWFLEVHGAINKHGAGAKDHIAGMVAPLRPLASTQLSSSLPSFASRFSC